MNGQNGYQTAFNLSANGGLDTQAVTVKITLVPKTATLQSAKK